MDWRDALRALSTDLPEGEADVAGQTSDCDDESRQQGTLDIVTERKGRAGKTATIVSGFTIDDDEIESLASEMKRRLGCGGSVRGGEILVQGDRRQAVLDFLLSKGFKARII